MVKAQPPAPSSEPVLHRILREAWEFQRSGRLFLAAFDLDSTLFDLTLRVISIVDGFANDSANQALFPAECAALKKVEIRRTDWGLAEPLARIGLTTQTAFYRALHAHWAECFFSNDYLTHDEPMPGAVEYVQELHQVGAHIMYLTGRDHPRMGVGTELSLRARGFPVAPSPEVQLVLKPTEKLDDAEFKLDVLRKAEHAYDRIWLFENEPVNLNLIALHCPEIGLVYIDSVHSGREQPAAHMESILHFSHLTPPPKRQP